MKKIATDKSNDVKTAFFGQNNYSYMRRYIAQKNNSGNSATLNREQ